MYVYQSDTLTLEWSTEMILSSLIARTAYNTRTLSVDAAQLDPVDTHAISLDEAYFVSEFLPRDVHALFALFSDLADREGDSVFVERTSADGTARLSGFTIHVPRVVNIRKFSELDSECLELLLNALLIEWWASVGLSDKAAVCMEAQAVCVMNIKRLLPGIMRPVYGASYTTVINDQN